MNIIAWGVVVELNGLHDFVNETGFLAKCIACVAIDRWLLLRCCTFRCCVNGGSGPHIGRVLDVGI